jgi:hypothetical protein
MAAKMSLLEELVAERTRLTLGATAVRETELLAERFANALFKDPIIRARLATLVEKHTGAASRLLLADEPRARARTRKKRR